MAIQGHPTRGKDVIRILESLGGINSLNLLGTNSFRYYYICDDNVIRNTFYDTYYKMYTLEEFEQKFPFKIGDIVWKIEDVWHLDDKETWTYHYEKEVVEFMIRSISISCNSKGIWTKKFRICEVRDGKVIDSQRNIEFEDFGITVFPVREQAEKSLKDEFDR